MDVMYFGSAKPFAEFTDQVWLVNFEPLAMLNAIPSNEFRRDLASKQEWRIGNPICESACYLYTVQPPKLNSRNYIRMDEPIRPSLASKAKRLLGEHYIEECTWKGAYLVDSICSAFSNPLPIFEELGIVALARPFDTEKPTGLMEYKFLNPGRLVIKNCEHVDFQFERNSARVSVTDHYVIPVPIKNLSELC